MKRIEIILTLLFLTTTGWASQIVNPAASGGGGGGGSSVYPATGTASFPFGMSVSTITGLAEGTSATQAVNYNQWSTLANANILINGNFYFWQRGTSFATSATGTYGCDRWQAFLKWAASPPTITMSQETSIIKFGNRAMKVVDSGSIAANQSIMIQQQIEDYWDYAGSSVTVSVWLNATSDADNDIVVAIGDSIGASTSTAVTVDSAYHYITLTRFLSSSITNLQVRIGRGNTGTHTSTWYAADAMLVAGDVAVPFFARPYSQELALCQRYYEKSYEVDTPPATATSTALLTLAFPQDSATTCRSTAYGWKVQMRISPTMTYYNGSGTTGTWTWLPISGGSTQQSVSSDNPSQTQLNMAASFTTHGNIAQGHFTADAEMP